MEGTSTTSLTCYTGVLFLVALSWMKVIESLVNKNQLHPELSRKAIHIGIGVLYLLCWPLYPKDYYNARYLASLVPLSVLLKLMAIGMGILEDKTIVKMLCRENAKPIQLLLGPTLYGIIIIFCTIKYWTENSFGIIAITILCVGDGMAAIGGKFYPIEALPWNNKKSLGGMISFVLFSFLSIVVLLSYFNYFEFPVYVSPYNKPFKWMNIWVICSVCAFIESIPLVGPFDNMIIPSVSLFFSYVWL